MIAYGIVVFKNIFYELKFLFQINWIFKIYKGVMQKKNVNVNKKCKDQHLAEKYNKFIKTGYRLQSICMLENNQR